MTVFAYSRGHKITTVGSCTDATDWRWADDGAPIHGNDRPCARCGRMPTINGHDACLADIPDVVAACCGHGVQTSYMILEDGTHISPYGN